MPLFTAKRTGAATTEVFTDIVSDEELSSTTEAAEELDFSKNTEVLERATDDEDGTTAIELLNGAELLD
jgi:hypothetical protein